MCMHESLVHRLNRIIKCCTACTVLNALVSSPTLRVLFLLLAAFNDRKFGELGRAETGNELSLLVAKGLIGFVVDFIYVFFCSIAM